MSDVKSCLLVGVGGQGAILISKIMSNGFMQAGYDVKQSEVHGMAQRGGSVSTQVRWGDKVYGPVLCGRVEAVKSTDGGYNVRVNDGKTTRAAKTVCSNLHEGDLVAYNTKSDTICTLEDLHAEQKEFPHCIADGIATAQMLVIVEMAAYIHVDVMFA